MIVPIKIYLISNFKKKKELLGRNIIRAYSVGAEDDTDVGRFLLRIGDHIIIQPVIRVAEIVLYHFPGILCHVGTDARVDPALEHRLETITPHFGKRAAFWIEGDVLDLHLRFSYLACPIVLRIIFSPIHD